MKSKQFILATVLGATAFSAWADDSYQHIRNATAKVEYAGQTFLIDPFFAPQAFHERLCRHVQQPSQNAAGRAADECE